MGKNGAITNENKKMREFLRYLVPLADGFSIVQEDGFENIIYSRNGYIFKQRIIGFQNCLIYPQLLQSAIEGVNTVISVSSGYIEMGDPDDPFYGKRVSDYDSIDKAKEAALNIYMSRRPLNADKS